MDPHIVHPCPKGYLLPYLCHFVRLAIDHNKRSWGFFEQRKQPSCAVVHQSNPPRIIARQAATSVSLSSHHPQPKSDPPPKLPFDLWIKERRAGCAAMTVRGDPMPPANFGHLHNFRTVGCASDPRMGDGKHLAWTNPQSCWSWWC